MFPTFWWEPSRHGACSRLADICWLGNRFDGSGPKKKSQAEDLPYCSYRAVGNSSSFHFAPMFETVWWPRNQPMWTCTVTQITGHHIQNRHHGFTDPVRTDPRSSCSLYAHGSGSSAAIRIITGCFSACVLLFSDQIGFRVTALL